MVINQRGSSTTSNGYALDRWKIVAIAGSKMTVQQSTDAPTGFSNSMLITSSAATTIGTSDYYDIGQLIEGFNSADLGFGTANAKTVTVSFWAKSSLTGTFGASLQNSAQNRAYPFTYTISSANTWEYKTATIAGDTTGTWIGATNETGMQLLFGLGMGSNYQATAGAWFGGYRFPTGAVNLLATNAATLQITGVQLEVGSSATSFEYRPYGTELNLCQRYYYLHSSYATNNASSMISLISLYSSTDARGIVSFPVTMRTSPSLLQGSGSNYYTVYSDGNGIGISSFTQIANATPQVTQLIATVSSLTSGYAGFCVASVSGGYIAFSAEL
jgi:hypothetical protein